MRFTRAVTFRALSAFGNSFGQPINGILTPLQPTTLPHHFHLLLSKSLSTQSPSFILRSTSSGPGLVISKLHLLCHQLIYPIIPSPFPNTHLAYPLQPDDSADPNFESFAHQGVAYQTQTYHHKTPTTTGPCVLSNNPPTSTSKISVIKMAQQAEAYATSV